METGTTSQLEQRLDRLEGQVKRYRLITFGLCCLVVGVLVMGAAQIGRDAQDTIRAKNYYVVDGKGNDIAVLGNSKAGTAGLWFFHKKKSYVVVEQENSGANAIMHAKYFDVESDGKHLASLGTSKSDTPGLWFYHNGKGFIVIEKVKGPNVVFHGAKYEILDNQKLLGAMGISKSKNPGLWLRDNDGKEYNIIGSNGQQIWLNEVEFGKVKSVLSGEKEK